MPRHGLTLALLAILAGAAPAQAPIEIESEGQVMQARLFDVDRGGGPTLVLLPGWPGNPDDVLGLGARLSERGVRVLMVLPRGMHGSEGATTYAGVMTDVRAALDWLRQPERAARLGIDTTALALGGYSWGGGMALAYAARDEAIRRLVSIAGTDHAVLIRRYLADDDFRAMLRGVLERTRAPEGPVRFDLDGTLRELAEHQALYGLRENAPRLADRAILMIGAWADRNTSIEEHILPFYRALEAAGATAVTVRVHHADHGFRGVREELAAEIAAWILEG